MQDGFSTLTLRIGDFLQVSQDGYAIFSADDTLIGCNQAFSDVLFMSMDALVGQTFNQIYTQVYLNRQGPKIDTSDINAWLDEVNAKRRVREFRIFEIDLVDGRWFLVSEQTLPSQEVLLQVKNITRQKIQERKLHRHTSELSNLAWTDDLTQIANRRSFIAQVDAELNRCQRSQQAATFCLLDIDYFKKINDKYGHLVGDQVLIQIVEVIKSLLRDYDPLGRMGGEEFGILLPNTNLQQAIEIAQRLCDLIVQTTFKSEGLELNITVSIGIMAYSANNSFKQLYKGADMALYQAKRAGRNQISVYNNE